MTTEDDFQRALDAHPDDWQTRLVFADWLEERDDQRAEGYRALGVLRCRPRQMESGSWAYMVGTIGFDGGWWLSHDWYFADGPDLWGYDTRREAEDAAARAFAKLPPERRAELLAAQPA